MKFRCVGWLTDRQPLIGHHVMIEFVDLTMPDVNPKQPSLIDPIDISIPKLPWVGTVSTGATSNRHVHMKVSRYPLGKEPSRYGFNRRIGQKAKTSDPGSHMDHVIPWPRSDRFVVNASSKHPG